MSSIERYIDKLGSTAATDSAAASRDFAIDAHSEMTLSSADAAADSGKTTQQKVVIDFGRLDAAGMLTPDASQGRLADEYRAIKRPLLKNAFGEGVVPISHGNLIMVTSALPGEGKTFTSIGLAISMAQELDRTVLLVEADVAKPAVCQYCGIPEPERGLVDYLADAGTDLSELLMKTNVPKLTILPAGRRHPATAELLGSHAMRDLMDQLATRYPDRVVLFDSPPLLMSNEAVTLSALVGQVIVVVEAARTPQAQVRQAIELLDPEQTVGVVLNKNRTAEGVGHGGYGYGYGAAGREG